MQAHWDNGLISWTCKTNQGCGCCWTCNHPEREKEKYALNQPPRAHTHTRKRARTHTHTRSIDNKTLALRCRETISRALLQQHQYRVMFRPPRLSYWHLAESQSFYTCVAPALHQMAHRLQQDSRCCVAAITDDVWAEAWWHHNHIDKRGKHDKFNISKSTDISGWFWR